MLTILYYNEININAIIASNFSLWVYYFIKINTYIIIINAINNANGWINANINLIYNILISYSLNNWTK